MCGVHAGGIYCLMPILFAALEQCDLGYVFHGCGRVLNRLLLNGRGRGLNPTIPKLQEQQDMCKPQQLTR
eukprot:4725448-Pleurochrysis_carterae.AAC.1